MPNELNLDAHIGSFVAAQKEIERFLDDNYAKLPDRLHHFAPDFGALKSILGSKQMWASHAYDMNDKRELWYGSYIVHACLEEKRKLYAPRKIFQLDEFFDMALERSNPYSNSFNGLQAPFVISLCEDGNSNSQWEKYGNKGKGYCLNFRTTKPLLPDLAKRNLMLLKVIYDINTQVSLINTAIQKEVNHILAHLNDPSAIFMGMGASVAFYQLLLIYTISFKSKNWSDEREWRLVRGTSPILEPVVPETREKDGSTIRFTRVEFSDFAPFSRVQDISAGAKAIPEEVAQVTGLLDSFRS
ncbi:DUF2971 domain-containing protein [Massilia sp. CMS3.1]|uniref:DUF2971 domain-containing protein n=1 Tax=Massilia sp. CMS3.1 TaxID=3373083 RepID=UPI003EE64DAF